MNFHQRLTELENPKEMKSYELENRELVGKSFDFLLTGTFGVENSDKWTIFNKIEP